MKKMAPVSPNWRNEVTLRSWEMIGSFEPLAYLHRVAPRPLMFIGAESDSLIPFELAKQAFERAGEPKQLLALPSGHFDCYSGDFERSASAARDWFAKHLGAKS